MGRNHLATVCDRAARWNIIFSMKTCSKCKESLPLSAFHAKKGVKSGLCARCKKCNNLISAEYQERNKSKLNAQRLAYRIANREKLCADTKAYQDAHKGETKERMKRYHEIHRDRASERNKKWRSENKQRLREYSLSAQVRAKTVRRKARKMNATPAWANQFFIDEAYSLAKLREKVCGGKWHVDHIVPLTSKVVCGLHVEHNLQVIPMSQNISKGNRWWPDMP